MHLSLNWKHWKNGEFAATGKDGFTKVVLSIGRLAFRARNNALVKAFAAAATCPEPAACDEGKPPHSAMRRFFPAGKGRGNVSMPGFTSGGALASFEDAPSGRL